MIFLYGERVNMHIIDLNSDLGESFGAYTLGMDEQLMDYITSANVACGWHAGDPMVMQKTLRAAVQKVVHVHRGLLRKIISAHKCLAYEHCLLIC